jgi:hypothetical protein
MYFRTTEKTGSISEICPTNKNDPIKRRRLASTSPNKTPSPDFLSLSERDIIRSMLGLGIKFEAISVKIIAETRANDSAKFMIRERLVGWQKR